MSRVTRKQKNEAGISNGISREQIAALPDKNIGETLKRISDVSTNDNRQVVVRGITERYNLAMIDGAILPSTYVLYSRLKTQNGFYFPNISAEYQ